MLQHYINISYLILLNLFIGFFRNSSQLSIFNYVLLYTHRSMRSLYSVFFVILVLSVIIFAEEEPVYYYEEDGADEVEAAATVNVDANGAASYYYEGEAGGYYYEEDGTETAGEQQYYYEEEVEEIPEPVVRKAPPIPPPSPVVKDVKYGFLENTRGTIMLTSGPLVTHKYLAFAQEEYDCLLRKDQGKGNVLSAAERHALAAAQNPSISEEDIQNRAGGGADGGKAAAGSGADEKENGAKKRLTFREREMMKMEAKKADMDKSSKGLQLFRLGPSCEDRVCTSCKIIVEEFGERVLKAVSNRKYQYIMDLTEESFCDSREIQLKYKQEVFDICKLIVKIHKDYRDTLVSSFEFEEPEAIKIIQTQHTLPGYNQNKPMRYWDIILKNTKEYLYAKKQNVCVTIGACQSSDFGEIETVPTYRQQEYWNETCYVCSAAVKDMENRITLENGITEGKATGIVGSACEKLGLFSPEAILFGKSTMPATASAFFDICTSLTSGTRRDDLGWVLKVHAESVDKKGRSDTKFDEKACQEVKFCEKWIDPTEMKKIELEKAVDAVFS